MGRNNLIKQVYAMKYIFYIIICIISFVVLVLEDGISPIDTEWTPKA